MRTIFGFLIAVVLGALAYGSTAMAAPPIWQEGNVTQVKSGVKYSCAIASGKVYCWGNNASGQLGNGTTVNAEHPVAVDASGVLAGKTATQVSVSMSHTCAVADGAAYCWGDNSYARLGDGTNVSSLVPVRATGELAGKTVTQVATGEDHSCAIADGKVYCWGINRLGSLGVGDSSARLVPTAVNTSGVLAGKTVTAITAGGDQTCALADGKVYCWGANFSGELGNGSVDTNDHPLPTAVNTSGVLAGKTVTAIASGLERTCAIADARLYCWGGGLDIDDFLSVESSPVVIGGSGVLAGKDITGISLSGGSFNGCVIAGGDPYCWGSNTYGELSEKTASNVTIESAIRAKLPYSATGKTITSIVSGASNFTCAIADGSVYCWGLQQQGQLGTGVIPSGTDSSAGPSPVTTRAANASDRKIHGVSFATQSGKLIMTIAGEYMINNPNMDEYTSGLYTSLVRLNGAQLPFCTEGTGSTASQLESIGGFAPASDTPLCYFIWRPYPHAAISESSFQVHLPNNFNTSAQGTVSVNGSDEFTFNQPDESEDITFVVDNNKSLTATPQIAKRPTFTGTAAPGSTITVTVHSDPVTCTTTADSNGNWSCILPIDLDPGQHSVYIRVVAPDTTVSEFGPYSVTVPGVTTITDQTPLAPLSGFQRRVATINPFILIILGVLAVVITVMINYLYGKWRISRAQR